MYVTTDGTIKTTYQVDPTASSTGKGFWQTTYSQPDLALNLPMRFIHTTGDIWEPNVEDNRKEIRGFFVRSAEENPITHQHDLVQGAVTAPMKVTLEARVYNYSVPSLANLRLTKTRSRTRI